MTTTPTRVNAGLEAHGLDPVGTIVWSPTTAQLYTAALKNGDGALAHGGPLAVDTGTFTGRSPKDKFVVEEPGSQDRIWWGEINHPLPEDKFDGLRAKVVEHLDGARSALRRRCLRRRRPRPPHRRPRRHRQPLPRPLREDDVHHAGRLGAPVVRRPTCSCSTLRRSRPTRRPTAPAPARSSRSIRRRDEVLIGGTFYAGEIKKAIFTVMNDRLPLEGVLPMHCSANVGEDGKVAVFFGLSGTGKTTLSADPDRSLIGDDEHGWGANGVFNIEGGCYAKVIRLSAEAEPEIFKTTRTYGTVLENVVIDERGVVDLDDDSKTENTRAAYKLERISNAVATKLAGHPTAVVMLTADAFGILPPIARLSRDQALFYFLSGFTAKLAGTEIGVQEPQPTFSTCFGAPFLPQPPAVYARLLGEKLDRHGATVWLVNTGWTGGPYGDGHRMPIQATRRLLHAALAGQLDGVDYRVDEVFGFEVPVRVPGVEPKLLDPRTTWSDADVYDVRARELARLFSDNFEGFAGDAGPSITAAGPRV